MLKHGVPAVALLRVSLLPAGRELGRSGRLVWTHAHGLPFSFAVNADSFHRKLSNGDSKSCSSAVLQMHGRTGCITAVEQMGAARTVSICWCVTCCDLLLLSASASVE